MLTLSVGVLGIWLLLSGEPGTGATEHHRLMHESGHHERMDMGNHDDMHRAPSDRGILGGYTGMLGLTMLIVFIGLTGILIYSFFRESSTEPQQTTCWNCQRPVETDWKTCPFCDSVLPENGQNNAGKHHAEN